MNNNIVDRIKAFMQYKSLNSLSLSKELGYNSSEKISRLFRDKKAKPSYDIIYDISNKFEINVDWLITGRGSMLKDEQKHENTVTPNTTDATYVYNMYEDYKKLQEKILVEKEKRIKELETKLAQLEKQQESLTTNSSSHAETAQKKRSSSRISGSSAQPDAPTIK